MYVLINGHDVFVFLVSFFVLFLFCLILLLHSFFFLMYCIVLGFV